MNYTDYFHSQNDYFWVWEEDADVMVIRGGNTIGYRIEAADELTGIAENGLPPFGAFLLVKVAINTLMDDGVEQIAAIAVYPAIHGVLSGHRQIFDDAFTFLKILQTLPQEYTTGKRRNILLQTIFSDCHNRINSSTSKGIATALKDTARAKKSLQKQRPFNTATALKDFRTVALLLQKFPDAQSIIRTMGKLPDISESEIPIAEQPPTADKAYKDFVEVLIDNPKTFHAATLIKPIWAGFNVPIFNAHPSDQPLGGVADLSNKGDFDKLLISEFANDELVFMNRIANNEALYIRREMPPVKDKLHRNILIDVSLKCWGTPKILAYATYIAIARHPKSSGDTAAFAVGNECVAVSCSNELNIIDGLQKVDAGLHAAKGLTAFLEANKQNNQLELFFITTADSFKYPDVQKILFDHRSLFKYIITTNQSGEINFYRRTNNAQKHLQTIRLPLERLWTKSAKNEVQPSSPTSPPPAYDIIPMLIPTPMQIRKTIPFEDDIYIIANKCLYKRTRIQNEKSSKGWELLLRNIPANSRYELGRTVDKELQFLSFNPQNKELRITNLDTMQQAKTAFEYWSPKRYPEFLWSGHNFFYLLSNPEAYTFNVDFKNGTIKIELHKLSNIVFDIDYPGRQKQINSCPAIYPNSNLLKNISDIFINQENFLVFNKHQLSVQHESIVSLSSPGAFLRVHRSIKDPRTDTFTFKDGSRIIIDRCGVAILISSNPAISPVYIVLTMNISSAMATQTAFAGNQFFYNELHSSVEIAIEAAGPEPLKTIQVIKSHFANMGLREVKELVDGAPKMLPTKVGYSQALKLVRELADHNCKASFSRPKHPVQEQMASPLFYKRNITNFINHIITHVPAN